MGVVLDSHKYLYKLITINKHQKHFPRINRKEDVMYGIRKQNWQRHKVKRTPSAALNQYNEVCDSQSRLFLLINTYTYSIIYLPKVFGILSWQKFYTLYALDRYTLNNYRKICWLIIFKVIEYVYYTRYILLKFM